MITGAAQVVTVLAGLWLIGLGLLMVLRPSAALTALAQMGGTSAVHVGEMAIRTLIGLALVFVSDVSRFPLGLVVIGCFLVASALVLLALPRRWHAGYSLWWALRIPIWAVRLIGPLSWAMGGGLIWVVV